MDDEKRNPKLIFQSSKSTAWAQVITVYILECGGLIVFSLGFIFPIEPDENLFWRFGAMTLMAVCIIGTAPIYLKFHVQMTNAEIANGIINGATVFGKEKSFKIEDTVRVQKQSWGNENIEFVTRNGEKFCFYGGVDFLGFLYDYILSANPDIEEADDSVAKLREDEEYWTYTCHSPFKSKYPDGYLESFRPVLNAQKEQMIKEGKLKPDTLYGNEDDPFTNPNSWVAKERRRSEAARKRINERSAKRREKWGLPPLDNDK